MKTIFSLFILMSLLTACNRTDSRPVTVYDPSIAHNFSNVSYGKDTLQRLDVYLPAGRSSQETPSIVLIHGGGWNSGSKAEFSPHIDSFKKRMPHYAIFNLDYRLVNGGNVFPAQEEDVKTALQYILSKAEEYNISKGNIVLLGFSAGGHLALLQGYKYQTPKVKAVVDFFGPTDLVTMYNQPWHPLVPLALQMVTGATPLTNPSLYTSSSPVHFITSQSPPTLILHGGQDPVVDISQSRLLKQKLDAAGVKNELVEYPSERHGWYGSTLTQSFNRMESFLRETVK